MFWRGCSRVRALSKNVLQPRARMRVKAHAAPALSLAGGIVSTRWLPTVALPSPSPMLPSAYLVTCCYCCRRRCLSSLGRPCIISIRLPKWLRNTQESMGYQILTRKRINSLMTQPLPIPIVLPTDLPVRGAAKHKDTDNDDGQHTDGAGEEKVVRNPGNDLGLLRHGSRLVAAS